MDDGWLARAVRLLGDAADAFAPLQLRPYLLRVHAARHPEDDQVIEDVGALRHQRLTVAGYRLDQALHRFLAEFLRDLGDAARHQPRRVADIGIDGAAV